MKLNIKFNQKRQIWVWLTLLLLVGLIQLITLFPPFIERFYSCAFYKFYAQILRALLGWIPYSAGDLLYFIVGVWGLVWIIKLLKYIFTRNWKLLTKRIILFVKIVLVIYIWFMLGWGLNYHRQGIAEQLNLQVQPYSTEELCTLRDSLAVQLNYWRKQVSSDTTLPTPALKYLYHEAAADYLQSAQQYSFLKYAFPSIKSSLFSPWAKYFGWGGYYNPFTGEAQVRNNLPRILIPFTVLHEIAHQIGYAGEEEANFVGFIVGKTSTHPYVVYSCYSELYKYVFSELLQRNTFPDKSPALDTLVKYDFKQINLFFRREDNNIAPQIMNLYDIYLKVNQQTNGIDSYNQVVGLLIAYQKKYGKI